MIRSHPSAGKRRFDATVGTIDEARVPAKDEAGVVRARDSLPRRHAPGVHRPPGEALLRAALPGPRG